MSGRPLESSSSDWVRRQPTLEELIADLRPAIRRKVTGEGTNPSSSPDVAEALAQVLGFACAVERLLINAAGGAMPGHMVSVRGYVDQVLAGEARETSARRLTGYFRDALALFLRNNMAVESALTEFARDLAEALRPSRIEEQARVGALFGMMGLKEIAYWREYKSQLSSLDAAGMMHLAREQSERRKDQTTKE